MAGRRRLGAVRTQYGDVVVTVVIKIRKLSAARRPAPRHLLFATIDSTPTWSAVGGQTMLNIGGVYRVWNEAAQGEVASDSFGQALPWPNGHPSPQNLNRVVAAAIAHDVQSRLGVSIDQNDVYVAGSIG